MKQHLLCITQRRVVRTAFAAVSLAILAFSSSALAASATQIPGMGPVPKAHCGRFDWTESGLQGETTTWERESGDSEGGYNCNLELVGQFRGEGAFSQNGPAYYDHCAYMSTENDPQQEHPGVVVIDVSDPTNPRPTAYLDDTPAGLNPHENVKVNQKRGLLGLAQSNGPNFAVYDLSKDCAHPILASSITVPGSSGHMGGWAEDGMTYYIGQSFRGVGGTLPIIDVSDPYNAKHLLTWTFLGDGRPHDLSTNTDGTRLYSGQPGTFGAAANSSSFGPDGLVILDVSDIKFRRPNPEIRVVSTLFWDDQGQAEQMLPSPPTDARTSSARTSPAVRQALVVWRRHVRGGRRRTVIRTSSTSPTRRTPRSSPRSCSKCTTPEIANISSMSHQKSAAVLLDYSTERCAPDRPDNPTMLACGSRGTGTRVYDVRDILHPKEIAYWKGPAPRTAFLPGSGSWSPGVDRTVEKQAGLARFVKVPATNGTRARVAPLGRR